jgi:hypothetical protein
MLKLFSKERALYLVDNPSKWGFSWWFLFAGMVAGYWMYRLYGDSEIIIMVVEKYLFIFASLIFGIPHKLVRDRVRTGAISRDSILLYFIPPSCYVFTFFATVGFTHMFLVILLA